MSQSLYMKIRRKRPTILAPRSKLEYMNKRKKFLIKATTIALIITILLWVMPGRVKRYFPNYLFFSALNEHELYPNVLPLSAHNIRYYEFDSYYTDKSGYKATFSEKDYQILKAKQWEKYSGPFAGDRYIYSNGTKQYLNRDTLLQDRIDFIETLLLLDEDDGHYYYLVYDVCRRDNYFICHCLLCNDEKCELIELTYRYDHQ